MPTHHKQPRTPAKPKPNALPPPSAKASNAMEPATAPMKKGDASAQPSAKGGTPGPLQDYKQMQEDEVEVLKSIFMEDFKHVEKSGAWNTSTPSFKLRLKAMSDEQFFCILSVTMTATYPKSLPELHLTPSPNLAESRVRQLEDVIRTLPRKLVGQEMIFELATTLQDMLEDIVQNRWVDNKDQASLGQQYAKKIETEQKRAEEEEKELRRKLVKAEMEEQEQLQKQIEDELRRKREQAEEQDLKRRKSSLMDVEIVENAPDCIHFDRPIKVNLPEGGGSCIFRTVCGMVKMSDGPIMSVYTVRPAFPAHEAKNVPLVLKQLQLPDSFADSQEGKQKIQELEQELDGLKELTHPNIIQLYESKVSRDVDVSGSSPGSSSHSGWRVSILTEYANKGTLRDLLDTVDRIKVDTARSWTISLLEGLDHIHRKGAVHNDIHVGNILLNRESPEDPIIAKLADVGYMNSIHGILQRGHSFIGHPKAASWFPPEMSYVNTTDTSVRKMTRKSDIWNLGIIVLQMLFGLKVLETYDSPQKLLHSMDLSESLSDFLESIFRADPKKRPTAFELIPSEFLRNDEPITYTPSPRAPSPAISRQSWSMYNHHRHHSRGRHGSFVTGGTSRYATDFVELGRLGKGGYGQVVKARNRLDGREYAIKIITQTSGNKLTEILSEVMLLSRLNHQYVVRYFTAWLEDEDSHDKSGFVLDSEMETDSNAITDSSGSHTDRSTGSARTDVNANQDSSIRNDGLDIEFGHSTSGLDFISSNSGYPSIQFGDDSDEDEETDEEEDESDDDDDDDDDPDNGDEGTSTKSANTKNMPLKRVTSNERRRGKVTLYIQMSLAERLTLRDRIRQGIELDECWKLLRQILEGLAHIHGLGIIHRDLKPENIFIDYAGDPQIGDFGLATNDLVVNNSPEKTIAETAENELTTNVGTALYVAPELRHQGTGNYNEKVDMYSLGIIFFEMCYPLGSGMERADVLTKIREPEIKFPPEFWTEKRKDQGEIIKALLDHDASKRPTSVELLNSGKLPFMIEERAIRHALASLADPRMPGYQQVMQALFSQPTMEYKDHTYDTNPQNKPPRWNQLLLQSHIDDTLTDIFRHHGAVEHARPLFMPRNKQYSRDAIQVIDSNGTLLQLPYDLTLPYARVLAREMAPAPRTYTFGTVYRKNTAGGQPTSVREVDFDIISYDSLDLSLKEAEVIKVLDEVIDAFPGMSGVKMCFHINHSLLLDAIMEFCRIQPPQRSAAKEILSRLNIDGIRWPQIRKDLATAKLGILPTSLDDLQRFDWRMEPEKAFLELQKIFEGSPLGDKIQSVFVHIRAVVIYTRQFGVHRQVYLNPLGTFNDRFYRGGIMFQCVFDTKKRHVFAAGGRYDSLIQDLKPKLRTLGHSAEVHAVGCNLGWQQLCIAMENYIERSTRALAKQSKNSASPTDHDTTISWTPRRCDVLVTAFDHTALRTQGIAIVAELWAAGISAELAASNNHGHTSAMESLLYEYKPYGINWIVSLKHKLVSDKHSIHIKPLTGPGANREIEVKNTDLVTHLKTEIADRDRRVHAHHLQQAHGGSHQHLQHPHSQTTKLLRHGSADVVPRGPGGATFPLDENNPAMDVRVLMSDYRKGRKIPRSTIIDSAQRAAIEGAAELLKCPIVAMDLSKDALNTVRRIGLSNPAAWKKLLVGTTAVDSKYLADLHELLQELKEEGAKEVWVYSVKTGDGGIVFLG